MLRKLRERIAQDEKGFTLIELLVVMLIIGILAAIALPIFLGQQEKGKDAAAKSNARNLVSHVESCYAETELYASCNNASALDPTGLPYSSSVAEDKVTVVSTNDTSGSEGYVISSVSKGAKHEFRIIKSGSSVTRECDTDGVLTSFSKGGDEGGCQNGNW